MKNQIEFSGYFFEVKDSEQNPSQTALEFLVDGGYIVCEDCNNTATQILTGGADIYCFCDDCAEKEQENLI